MSWDLRPSAIGSTVPRRTVRSLNVHQVGQPVGRSAAPLGVQGPAATTCNLSRRAPGPDHLTCSPGVVASLLDLGPGATPSPRRGHLERRPRLCDPWLSAPLETGG